MSLIELTFGSEGGRALEGGVSEFLKNPSAEAEFRVIKTDQFFGTKELCVVGQLTKGVIAKEMTAQIGGVESEVACVESRYGTRPVSRPGTQVLLMLTNVTKKDVGKDDTLVFHPKVQPEEKKSKGRIIIA